MSAEVLLVDDDEETLTAFGVLLRRLGCAVDKARSGDEARAALQARRYRLVITDLHLTGACCGEGEEIVRFTREHQPETPVILMTGYGSPAVMSQAYALGASFYLEKPVPPRLIADALAVLL